MGDKQIDVLLYGLGAIGSFYAFILSRNENVRLTVVARSNYEAVKANSLHISSENHGDHLVKPYKVAKTVVETGATFDYIVCAHKAIDQAGAVDQVAPGVDESKTTICLMQNGVGNEEPFRRRFPSVTIISCVVWVGATQPEPGIVKHTKSEETQIGLFPSQGGDAATESQHLDQFASLLTGGKTSFQVVPDIQVFRWEKVVWNAAWNTLTTLTLMDTHSWLSSSEGSTPMTRKLMKEVIDVARGLGIKLEHDLIDKLLDKILAMPPIGSSMKTDYEKGNPMEVEIILGYPVKKGKELGIDVSTIETLYLLLTAINKRLMEAKAS